MLTFGQHVLRSLNDLVEGRLTFTQGFGFPLWAHSKQSGRVITVKYSLIRRLFLRCARHGRNPVQRTTTPISCNATEGRNTHAKQAYKEIEVTQELRSMKR